MKVAVGALTSGLVLRYASGVATLDGPALPGQQPAWLESACFYSYLLLGLIQQ